MVLLLTIPAGSAQAVFAGGGAPDIMWMSGDMWLDPDETAYLALYLDGSADHVNLEYYSSADKDWYWKDSCTSTDGGGGSWVAEIDPAYWADDYIRVRFDIVYDGDKHTHSDEIKINWTYYLDYERKAGANRFETARKIADQTRLMKGGEMSKYPSVIIASGTDFADALGGSFLSWLYDAPILLVNSNPAVIQDVAGEIQSNMYSDGLIFILGGTAAVPADMEDALKAGGFSDSQILRFAGKNRYDTNLAILKFCGAFQSELMVCSGLDFADALSASAVGLPIMLVGPTVNSDQLKYVEDMQPTQITLIGGTGAVSSTVENQLRPYVAGQYGDYMDRLAGANRYVTSAMVANYYFADGHQKFFMTLAYAQDFPDGLAGGVFAKQIGAPLLLVDNNHYFDAEVIARQLGTRHAFVLGGPTLISDATTERILDQRDL